MLKRLFAFVVLLALVALGLYYSGRLPASLLQKDLGPVAERFERARLATTVKAALRLHRLTRDARIDVSSEDGVVTLRGDAGSDEARTAAVRVAAAVPDVAQVVSHLKVVAQVPAAAEGRSLGESLDDRTLEVGVRMALSLRRELKGSDIGVRVFRREVTLTGEIADEDMRQVAVGTARETAGVSGVKDDLRLHGATAREKPPGAAREAAERAIRANPNLANSGIKVADEGGRLVLRGRVHTGAEKDLAALIAREAAGGPVENALQIHP